jgi:hypothetical protein
MNPDELRQYTEALEEMRRAGALSAETLAKMGKSSTDAAAATDKTTKAEEKKTSALTKGTTAVVGLSKELGSWGGALAKGQGSFESLIPVVSGAIKVLGDFANIVPVFGGSLKALADGVGDASKFVLESLGHMAKSYQELGDASAVAADGVDGLYRQLNQIGNTSLPAFTKAVAANAEGLAIFGGGVAAGAEEFSKLTGALTTGQIGQEFLKLGMSFDTVSASAAKYISSYVRLGALQNLTTQQLTERTQTYLKEVDLIARMTGKNRQQQEDEQQKSLNDARFRAKIADMQASGQGKAADELEAYVRGLKGPLADAARATLTGVPMTEEAANANMLYGDQIRKSILDIQNGAKATKELTNTMMAGARGAKQFGKLIEFTGADAFGATTVSAFDDLAMSAKIEQIQKEKGVSYDEALRQAQEQLTNTTGGATETFTKTQEQVAETGKKIERLGFSLGMYALPALDAFSKGLDELTDKVIPKLVKGVDTLVNGGGPEDDYSGQGKEILEFLGTLLGGAGGAAVGMGETAVTLGVGGVAAPAIVAGGALGGHYLGGKGAEYLSGLGKSFGLKGMEKYFGEGPGFFGDKNKNQQPQYPIGPNQPIGGGLSGLQSTGIDIKAGAQRPGANLSPKVTALAEAISRNVSGFTRITSANDAYHAGTNSKHAQGLALDFTIDHMPDEREGADIVAKLKQLGASEAIDEYNHPSAGSTGKHFHAAVQSFAGGGIARGPASGYQATLHDTEAVIPLPSGGKIPVEIKSFLPEFAKALSMGTKDSFDSISSVGDQLAQAISSISQNKTAMPNIDSVINNLLPNFAKPLPDNKETSALSEKADKLSQQLDRIEKMPGTTSVSDNTQQLALMTQQIARLDDIVRVMSNQLNVSTKILSYQH